MELKKRQIIVVILVLMIIAAGYANYNYNKNLNGAGYFTRKQNGKLGNPVYVEDSIFDDKTMLKTAGANSDVLNENDNYFAQAKLNRQTAREQEVDTLEKIVNNSKTSTEEKDRASSNINKIVMNSDKEMLIEQLLRAKEFDECIVLIGDDNVNVIVKTQGLTQQSAAQIVDAVENQIKIDFKNIHIIERK